tara:strand:+ start:2532 stop:3281 length:750 start_codon:yes stop_codon:yes gene_type:complete
MKNLAVDTQLLTQKFGNYDAVKNLTLQIPEGEVFGFLGHNGAGKTTTIHMLTTLTKSTSGTAKIFGLDVKHNAQAVRQLIGYVPENVRLYDSLTTRENLMFFAGLSGIKDARKKIDEALEFLMITDLADKRVGSFSKGMRQRVGLAQAIQHEPKLLFLDEPASGLDPIGMKMLRELINQLNKEKKMTVFMNTHLLSEVSKTCTSIGVLSQGKLVLHNSVEEVSRHYGHEEALEKLYLNVHTDQKSGVVT